MYNIFCQHDTAHAAALIETPPHVLPTHGTATTKRGNIPNPKTGGNTILPCVAATVKPNTGRKERETMVKTSEYQVCAIDKLTKTAQVLEVISAENIGTAIEMASGKYSRGVVRVYPLVMLDNADSINYMAALTLASYENWERRNNFAALNPLERNQYDREDLLSVATIAILVTLAENPAATMYDVKTAAFAAIRTEQGKKDRNSEREYMPGWIACNVTPQEIRASCPALASLIREAIEYGDLTEGQMEALMLRYDEDLSVIEIAERTNRTRDRVYVSLYKAYYKTLKRAAELDGAELPTFKLAGYTAEDIAETLATLRQRGRMNKNQK